MPIYEYQCSECLVIWDEFEKLDAKPLTYCVTCDKHTAKRIISQVTSGKGFVLKGPGWANDGYEKK